MKTFRLHKDFRLNGESFSTNEELLLFTKNLDKYIYLFVKEWLNNNDFVIVKTSGSTGKPKVINLKKEHVKNSARATGAYFSLPEKSKALHCLSAEYIAGKLMLVRAMELGWYLDVVPVSGNPLKDITTNYDFVAMVPLQVVHSIGSLYKVKKLIIGGAPITAALHEKLQGLDTDIYLTYGMTETCTHIAAKQLNGIETDKLFHTLPNVEVATDDRGCLVIYAPLISDRPIVTNDLAKVYTPTTFEWLGRYDMVINSGGIKLIPEQIEQQLSPIMNHRYFVFGYSDEELGEKLVLVVEDCTASETTLQNYKERISQLNTLTAYEKPKQIFKTRHFAETPSGKIDRQATVKRLKIKP